MTKQNTEVTFEHFEAGQVSIIFTKEAGDVEPFVAVVQEIFGKLASEVWFEDVETIAADLNDVEASKVVGLIESSDALKGKIREIALAGGGVVKRTF